jgi:chemotaxis protein methyltransferase CheR
VKELDVTPSPLGAVMDLVGMRAGLAFPPNRHREVERAIRKAMVHHHVAEPEDFVRLLQADDQAFDSLIVDLTVGETYFFREPAQFEMLRREILPDIMRNRHPGSVLRLWSAGCATGEEPYSLAIVLEQEGLAGSAAILGTDISRAALARAHEATYGRWSLRNSPAEITERYFRRRDDRFHLLDRFRRRVKFDYLNLASDVYPSAGNGTAGVDVILCRNVLIYFEPDAVGRIAQRLFAALAPGGWLIAGPSDPPLWDLAPFETVVTEAGIFYRGRHAAGRPAPAPGAPRPVRAVGPAQAVSPARGAAVIDTAGTAAAGSDTRVAEAPRRAVATPLAEARQAFAGGDFDRVLQETRAMADDPEACALRICAQANLGQSDDAEATAATAVQSHPLRPELQYLRAIVLMNLERYEEAAVSLRRVIYLDRSLAVAHFTLGSVLLRCGAATEARHAYRNALALAAGRPKDEVVPLSEGERADRLAEAARAQLAFIEGNGGGGTCGRRAG